MSTSSKVWPSLCPPPFIIVNFTSLRSHQRCCSPPKRAQEDKQTTHLMNRNCCDLNVSHQQLLPLKSCIPTSANLAMERVRPRQNCNPPVHHTTLLHRVPLTIVQRLVCSIDVLFGVINPVYSPMHNPMTWWREGPSAFRLTKQTNFVCSCRWPPA